MTDSYTHLDQPGAAPEAPALFLFHGTGANEHQFFEIAAQIAPGARRVAPRGDVSEGGALRYFRRLAEGQYDMDDLARATNKMAAFVKSLTASPPPERVLGFGYSNGANILASVTFAAPALFDAVVLLHPLIPFDPMPQPGLADRRVLITAGRNDPICPAEATEALAGWYRSQGAATEIFWHEGGHELRPEELAAAQRFLATS